jgi:hypothetical protein
MRLFILCEDARDSLHKLMSFDGAQYIVVDFYNESVDMPSDIPQNGNGIQTARIQTSQTTPRHYNPMGHPVTMDGVSWHDLDNLTVSDTKKVCLARSDGCIIFLGQNLIEFFHFCDTLMTTEDADLGSGNGYEMMHVQGTKLPEFFWQAAIVYDLV